MGHDRAIVGRKTGVTPLASVVRLADQNAYGAFAARFRKHFQRRFIESFDGRMFSYADLDRITAQMAGLISNHGVRKGDRVAGLLEKSPESIMLYLAVARAGAVYMPLSTALRGPEIEYLLRDATPRLAICAPEHEAMLEGLATECGIERIYTLDATGGGSFCPNSRGAMRISSLCPALGRTPTPLFTRPAPPAHRRAPLSPMGSPSGTRWSSASAGSSSPRMSCCTRIRRRSASSARLPPCWRAVLRCSSCRSSTQRRWSACCRAPRCSPACPPITADCWNARTSRREAARTCACS